MVPMVYHAVKLGSNFCVYLRVIITADKFIFVWYCLLCCKRWIQWPLKSVKTLTVVVLFISDVVWGGCNFTFSR